MVISGRLRIRLQCIVSYRQAILGFSMASLILYLAGHGFKYIIVTVVASDVSLDISVIDLFCSHILLLIEYFV